MDYALSPIAMFLNAGPVSKVVMAALVGASIWTWIMIVDGVYVVRRISKAVKSIRDGGPVGVLWPIVAEGREALLMDLPGETARQRQTRVLQTMERATREFMSAAKSGMPSLAIVASVGPFVGLFGTVWGIMSSFQAIAASKNTSLAVVAPGIAEALFATALGLLAAIPAVMAYNKFSADSARLSQRLEAFADEFAAIVSRQIDTRS
jgi:biopolymer transport protein ExbB/TolQ